MGDSPGCPSLRDRRLETGGEQVPRGPWILGPLLQRTGVPGRHTPGAPTATRLSKPGEQGQARLRGETEPAPAHRRLHTLLPEEGRHDPARGHFQQRTARQERHGGTQMIARPTPL